ncbi:ABC transporter permease [Palaeococcus ferrophilus]|uniref:ABC transporter permease n=1 Tax=Palaeococcus ferrophilus TaxID=83868 RepID=UPI00064E478B|nr:ABC transporter permease [Palaeococcus ferrophilus]
MGAVGNIALKEVYVQLRTKRFYVILAIFIILSVAMVLVMRKVLLSIPEMEELYRGASPFKVMLTSSFSNVLQLLLPFLGGAMGYDIINRELEEGTIRSLLSKPVYRDEVVNGKFLGSAVTLFLGVTMFYVLTIALALLLGVPVGGDDALVFLTTMPFSLVYTLIFLAIGMLVSALVRKPTNALILVIVLIIFLQLVYPMVTSLVAFAIYHDEFMAYAENPGSAAIPEDYYKTVMRMNYIVPSTHYGAVVGALLGVKMDYTSLNFMEEGIFEERSITESLSLVWQNIVTMVVMLLLPFAVTYLRFMRMDLR